MWNEILNAKFTNRLIGYCQDKKVLIVGNAINLFANEYGDFIDSFDVVVRLGKGVPLPQFKKFLGSRTDVWVGSILRAHHYKDYPDAKYKVINITQISLYDENKVNVTIPKIFYSSGFQLYKDYFLIGNQDVTRSLIKKAYGHVKQNERMSQGAMALAYFTNIIRSYKELHVIGFDFFEGRLQYKLNDDINEVSSYHLPVPTNKGKNSNPHAGLYIEENLDKKYIQRLVEDKKIIFHEMENKTPSTENIQLMLDTYRPRATLVAAEQEDNNDESSD